MDNSFADRMGAQRLVLKEINRVAWPVEQLCALSQVAIDRWASVNKLGPDHDIVRLATEAGDALLFLANASQEQVSREYVSRSRDVAAILPRLRSALDARST